MPECQVKPESKQSDKEENKECQGQATATFQIRFFSVEYVPGRRASWLPQDWILWILCSLLFISSWSWFGAVPEIGAGVRQQLQRRRWRGAVRRPNVSLPHRASRWYQFPTKVEGVDDAGTGLWIAEYLYFDLISGVVIFCRPVHQVKTCLALNRGGSPKKATWHWRNKQLFSWRNVRTNKTKNCTPPSE